VATAALEVVTPDSGNTPNATGAFAPAVNDLLVVFVTKEASAASLASADLTSSVAPTGFTLIRDEPFDTNADVLAVFVADALCTNTTSRTVTLASGADPGAGTNICVVAVAGLTRVGSSAVRQSGALANQTTAIPSLTFDTGVALSANLILGAIGVVDGTPGLTAPASFSELADTGYTTGKAQGIEVVHRDSGHTTQTVAWQTVAASAGWAGIIVEMDVSAPAGPTENDDPTGTILLTGTRGENKIGNDSRSGQITLSGSATDSHVIGVEAGFVATQLQAVTRAANW
jgi:hypothetical protein